jgi:hypothetical protein
MEKRFSTVMAPAGRKDGQTKPAKKSRIHTLLLRLISVPVLETGGHASQLSLSNNSKGILQEITACGYDRLSFLWAISNP